MKIKPTTTNTRATMHKLTLLLLLFSFVGCSSISTFDQHAYIQTTSLKVDALNLMAQATDSFSIHAKNVAEVKTTNEIVRKMKSQSKCGTCFSTQTAIC